MPERVFVTVSLDVEEEGLFRGKYACHNPPVCNLASLSRLKPFLDFGVVPTLFCAWPVFTSPLAGEYLLPLLDQVEIGAHLHHWNTPPLAAEAESKDFLTSVPARDLDLDLFAAKLRSVLEAGKNFCGKPLTSFRMGRWDLHRAMLPILARNGIKCDASIRPLHWHADNGTGPDHFRAPADPYWINTREGRLLEIPLTVIPLFPLISRIPPKFLPALRSWGALALLAVYHPLWLLQLTTILHIHRGGRFLSLTWHSSEMQPGATPHLATEDAVSAFLRKIAKFLKWLEKNYSVTYLTMTQAYYRAADKIPVPAAKDSCDWTITESA